MERIEKDSVYFYIQNLVVEYLDLEKDEIFPRLNQDLNYLIQCGLQKDFYNAYNFLHNLKWFLGTDGKTKPYDLLDDIYAPIEINMFDVLVRIYKTYHG